MAYAAAGAATALGGGQSAEAAVHYSGPINEIFRGPTTHFSFLPLASSYSLEFIHFGGFAGFAVYSRSLASNGVRGFSNSRGPFVSRLRPGDNISAGAFVRSYTSYFAKMASGGEGEFRDKGLGFIGFRFRGFGGVPRYGWARVRMKGSNGNAFELIDYAWADAGEPIFAGQTSSDEPRPDQSVQENSLGWLALGAAGLASLRKGRSLAGR